jgi:hypothetical protein
MLLPALRLQHYCHITTHNYHYRNTMQCFIIICLQVFWRICCCPLVWEGSLFEAVSAGIPNSINIIPLRVI